MGEEDISAVEEGGAHLEPELVLRHCSRRKRSSALLAMTGTGVVNNVGPGAAKVLHERDDRIPLEMFLKHLMTGLGIAAEPSVNILPSRQYQQPPHMNNTQPTVIAT